MAVYKYIARNSTGQKREGLREAASSSDVLGWLRGQRCFPIEVSEVHMGPKKKTQIAYRKRIKSADLAAVCWQLSAMLEGGIPITSALRTICEDIENLQLQHMLMQVLEKVERGERLSESISSFPKVFNQLSCAMILAGETGGNLVQALQQTAEYFDNRDKLVRKVRGAVSYPIFALTFITILVIFIMTFIVPRFETIFAQIGGELPAFTRGFMAFYDAITNNFVYIAGLLIAIVIFGVLVTKTTKGHLYLSKLALRIPLIGKIISEAFVVMFCRTMSTLIHSGVSVMETFEILGGMTNNDVIRSSVQQSRTHILEGTSIALSMGATGFFPNTLIKMIQTGEDSGSLPKALEQTAKYYERRVDSMVSAITLLLEPVMIVTVGAIVGVIVLALYMPIFTMSTS